MRRDMRRNQNDDNFDTKKILYITGAILILAIITFAVAFYMYNKQWNEDYQEIGQINSITEDYEETSSSFGKTVNESQNEITDNNTEKIAVNTSKIEEKNSEESNATTDTSNNALEENNQKSKSNKENAEEKSDTAENTKENNDSKENLATEKNTEEKEKTETSEDTNKKEEAENPVFQMPVEGEIIKEFANTNLVYSNTLGEWVTHNGIDIKADKTTVVKAAEAGVVKSIKNDPRYGLTIVIEHDDVYQTVYSNLLTSEFVVEGETVEKGQSIGTVGNSAVFEIADEPHLHFEILKDSIAIDPSIYIK